MHVVPRPDRNAAAKAASAATRAPESDPAPDQRGDRRQAWQRPGEHRQRARPERDRARSGEARQGAPVRQPAAPAGLHAPAASASSRTRPPQPASQPVADGALGQYLARPYALRVNQVALQPLRKGSRVIAGHDPRPRRQGLAALGQADARPLRDPPVGRVRAADRPDADPRRLAPARLHAPLPRAERGPRRRRRLDRPGPADGQGGARAPRARQPGHHDLPVRAPGHPGRASSTGACSRRSSSWRRAG